MLIWPKLKLWLTLDSFLCRQNWSQPLSVSLYDEYLGSESNLSWVFLLSSPKWTKNRNTQTKLTGRLASKFCIRTGLITQRSIMPLKPLCYFFLTCISIHVCLWAGTLPLGTQCIVSGCVFMWRTNKLQQWCFDTVLTVFTLHSSCLCSSQMLIGIRGGGKGKLLGRPPKTSDNHLPPNVIKTHL